MAIALAEVGHQTIKQLAQADWHRSGLTDAHAKALRFKALSAQEVQKLSSRFHQAGALFIPYFDLAIGVCLVFGRFVRPAAILGGLFLLSVCLSQWPWAPASATA